MSSGQQSYNDDEDDWFDLQKAAKIDRNWKVYSREARLVKEAYSTYNMQGDEVTEYVRLNLELDTLKQDARERNAEYKLYLQLKNKYDQ